VNVNIERKHTCNSIMDMCVSS